MGDGTMICFDAGGRRFSYRAGGISIRNGWVLLNRGLGQDYWFIPGGRIEAGEDSAAALRREMLEELGEEAGELRFLCLVENFFSEKGRRFHELGMYYLMDCGDSVGEGRTIDDGGGAIEYRWLRLDRLHEIELYPKILKELIRGRVGGPRFVVRDDPEEGT